MCQKKVFSFRKGVGCEKVRRISSTGYGRIFLCARAAKKMKKRNSRGWRISELRCLFCMMIIGFAALNFGFTTQVNEIKTMETEDSQVLAAQFVLPSEENSVQTENMSEFIDITQAIGDSAVGEISGINSAIKIPDSELELVGFVEEPAKKNMVEMTSVGNREYSYVLSMEATAYLASDGNGDGITATGIPATYGVAAVDPSIIPLGSRLYIPGYGEAIAADTGGAIYGHRIDLCMESYAEAMQFGRRNVTVYILR